MFNRDFVSASSTVGLGALIGGLLSIEIASRFGLGSFLWIFGALFGGCVSYVTVEFKQFCEGVSDAYKKTVSWRPNIRYLKSYSIFFAGISSAICSACLMSFWVLILLDGFSAREFVIFGKVSVFIGLFFGTFLTHIPLKRYSRMTERQYTQVLLQWQKKGYWLLTRCNPLCALPTTLFYTYMALVWTVKAIPEMTVWVAGAGRSLKSFLVAVLKNVHSQKRAIVFFDATAGAVIGYLLGSALVGAFIGALVLYPLHRELVAVRLLKVVPR